MPAAFIYDAVRTPFGRYGGALAGVRPDDLAAHVVKALIDRNPDLAPIDDVLLGNANGAGEDNRNVARMAVLLAGLPVSVPGVTLNRLCGSGFEAVIQAARAIETGDARCCLAGGVESMTRAPWVLPKPDKVFPSGDATLVSTTLGWRLVNPAMPSQWTVSLGETAEQIADLDGITREEQDEFAVRSHQLAAAAWASGAYDKEIVAVPDTDLRRDESIRADVSLEGLAKLRPAFRRSGGTITAGNASPLSDGAACLVVAAEGALPGQPLARIVARGLAGAEPNLMGLAPVPAANQALERAGLSWDDIDLVELNEAFAAQVLGCLRRWPGLDPAKVNVDGGAIALGHPLGASGGRLLGHLVHRLKANGGGRGLATCCIGVGQGLAVIVEV